MILSTASPYKFSSSVLDALGEDILDDEFENINILYEKIEFKIPSQIKQLKNKKLIHKVRISKYEIGKEVLNFASRSKRISVPATSANLGPGFDALGLAPGLFNTCETCEFNFTEDKNKFEENIKNNLIYKPYKYAFDFYKKDPVPVMFDLDTDIPMSRGLGSSAA